MALPRAAWRMVLGALLAGLLLAGSPGAADIAPASLPALTGRVADPAHLLSQADEASVSAKLKMLEDQ